MTEFYAIIDDLRRDGPFTTMQGASAVLKKASRARGYTDEQARRFFLQESSVIKLQNLNGRQEIINVGWLAREESGREDLSAEAAEELDHVTELSLQKETDFVA
jgi:hypothetical protein